MGCGDTLNFISDPISGAFGFQLNPASLALQPWNAGEYFSHDWRMFKHWLVPDMRRDREVMMNSPNSSRRIIYGRVRVSGQVVYAETAGSKNEHLHLVVVFAGHPCDSIQDVVLDDTIATASRFSGKFHYEFFDGTQTEACASLVAASKGIWTTEHKLLGCTYLYCKLTWDEKAYPAGLPTIKAVVRGKRVYDPRTGLTEWSDNPSLCIRDYMLMSDGNGGMGCEPDEINDESFIVAANQCDELVDTSVTGVQEKRYTANGVINIDSTPADLLNGLLLSMDGTALYSQGQWKLFSGAHSEPVATLDESWLNGGISFSMGNKNDRHNSVKGTYIDSGVNGIQLEWKAPNSLAPIISYEIQYHPLGVSTWTPLLTIDPPDAENGNVEYVVESPPSGANVYRARAVFADGPDAWKSAKQHIETWAAVGFPDVTIPEYITEDGDEELSLDMTLEFTTSPDTAQRLGKLAIERSRRGMTVQYPCNMKAFHLEPYDVVKVNNQILGWNEKEFRILDWQFSPTGGVNLTLGEEDANMYDSPTLKAVARVAETDLPQPWEVVEPANLSVAEELYATNVASIIKSRVTLSWDEGLADVVAYEVQYGQDEVYANLSPVPAYAVGGRVSCQINDTEPGVFTFRVRAVNAIGATSEYTSVTQTIYGKTAPPPPVDEFLFARQPGGSRQFTWKQKAPPLDLDGYVIRFKKAASATWEKMYPLHDGLLYAAPYETNQLSSGTYTFAIKAKDTSGIYSEAVYIQAELDDPRLNGVITAIYPHLEEWPGTLTDCFINSANQLEPSDTTTTWDTLPASWAEWSAWNLVPAGTVAYECPSHDIGFVANFVPVVVVDGNGTSSVEVSTSIDGVTWSSWGAPSFVTARHIKVRVSLTSDFPIIYATNIYLDAPVLIDDINDLDTSTVTGPGRIGVGHIRLPVQQPYSIVIQVSLTLQSVGPGWTWELIDKDTNGPEVKIYNASGVLADCVIDAHVKGV